MRRIMLGCLALLAAAAVGISGCMEQATGTGTPSSMSGGMTGMGTDHSADDLAPLVRGIYEGEEVLFIHTEASEPEVAGILTEMMGPEVIVVPSLADIPPELRGNVYVFTNGIAGDGPMGFQPDVFDSVPGSANYTPLRTLNQVTWQAEITPRQLDSVADIEATQAAGEVTIVRPDVVVNMPILVWPGGNR